MVELKVEAQGMSFSQVNVNINVKIVLSVEQCSVQCAMKEDAGFK